MTDVASPGTGTDGDVVRPFTIGFPLEAVDDISLYWLTNAGISAARLYWENKGHFFGAKDAFPDELYQAPRSWAERAYPDNLIHFNEAERGGHFAAWEQPQIFCEELRESFRSLR